MIPRDVKWSAWENMFASDAVGLGKENMKSERNEKLAQNSSAEP